MSESKQLSIDVNSVLANVNATFPDDEDDAWKVIKRHVNAGELYTAITGKMLLIMRDRCPIGQFKKRLKEAGIPKATAYRYINKALLLDSLTDAKKRSLLNHNPDTVTVLVSTDDEAITGLSDKADGEEPVDDIDRMGTDEAKGHARKMEKERDKALDKFESERHKNRIKSKDGYEYPESITTVRIESTALADKIMLCLDDMCQLITLLTDAEDLSHEPSEREAQSLAGSTLLGVHIKSIYAKASSTLAFLNDNFEKKETALKYGDTKPMLSEKEAGMAMELREDVTAIHDMQKKLRENERHMNSGKAKRGRGRPRKVK